MSKELNLEHLLDQDDLSQKQQDYLLGLINYHILKVQHNPSTYSYNLVFKAKDDKDWPFELTISDPDQLEVNSFKQIMYHVVIEPKVKLVSDETGMAIRKTLMESFNIWGSARGDVKYIRIAGKKFAMREENSYKAQDLFKVVELIRSEGLV